MSKNGFPVTTTFVAYFELVAVVAMEYGEVQHLIQWVILSIPWILIGIIVEISDRANARENNQGGN